MNEIKANLLGGDVYYERMGSAISAVSAIDIACWDIKGKALELPVHNLLGGKVCNRLESYASDVYWQEDPEKMASEAVRIKKLGFKKIKMHIGVKSPREEYHRIAAIKDAVGTDVQLMVDLNAGYNLLEALEAEKIWRDFDLFWIEEPLPPSDLDGLHKLQSRSDTAISGGENIFGVDDFKRILDRGALDALMPDIGRVGGIGEAVRIANLARAYGYPVSPHNFSSGILFAATLHFLASLEDGGLLEIDTSGNAIYEELLVSKLEREGGEITVPDEPGLGVCLPKEILSEFKVA